MKNNGIHIHNCHICGKDFECCISTWSYLNCSIEDRYAICYSKECIEEFKIPTQREELFRNSSTK